MPLSKRVNFNEMDHNDLRMLKAQQKEETHGRSLQPKT